MYQTLTEKHDFGKFDLSAYHEALTLAKVGIWELDLETGWLHLNNQHIEILGASHSPLSIFMSDYVERYVYEKDREMLSSIVPKIMTGEWDFQHSEVEYRIIRHDGELIHVYVKMNLEHIHENRLWGITQDVSSTRKAENRLNETLRLLADLKFAIDESTLVTVTDVRGRITYVNDHFCSISGYTKEELIGKSHNITNSGYHPKSFFRKLWETIGAGHIWRGEICNKKKSGEAFWVDTTIVPFVDESGCTYQYTAIRTDITGRKEAELKISYLAYHDSLTGLPNRTYLSNRLNEMFSVQNDNDIIGIALFDLDNFKYINDHFGHFAGDELLKAVSNRLHSFLQADEFAARLGGDEFVLAISNLKSKEELSERLSELICHMKDPFIIENSPYYLSMSIGAASSEKGAKSLNELLKQADFAMYESKNGCNGICIFD